jgi:CheY-like chemotaxis protein
LESGIPRQVLLVEDDFLIGLLIEDMLSDLGYKLAAKAERLDEALELARGQTIDAALLDLQVAGAMIYPVADVLAERGIPFAFVTGHGRHVIDPAYSVVPVLHKPFRLDGLAAALEQLLAAGAKGA